jgi:hypothetical protein
MPAPTAEQIDLLRQRLAADRHLGVLITGSRNSTDPQAAVVNAAIITHPGTQRLVLALVARTGAKLGNLRRQPRATLVVRDGWEWIAVRGPVELSGPGDPNASFDTNNQRQLLRAFFVQPEGDTTTSKNTTGSCSLNIVALCSFHSSGSGQTRQDVNTSNPPTP